jgi:hypothetical protein
MIELAVIRPSLNWFCGAGVPPAVFCDARAIRTTAGGMPAPQILRKVFLGFLEPYPAKTNHQINLYITY